MSTASAGSAPWIAVAALLVSCAAPSQGGLGGAGSRQPTIVQFSHEAVDPATVRIAADGNVQWRNTAPDSSGFIVFPASIAASFRCSDLQPYFARAADVYRSLPITGGATSERVELPCSLAPGSYDYEIWLVGSGFGQEFDLRAPQKILRARILVE
jgi:hypothetical protein